MIRAVGILATLTLLPWSIAIAAGSPDPTVEHRWHMPRRGARTLAREVAGPVREDWDAIGKTLNEGKDQLAEWGLRFDLDLDFFDQYASRVVSGRQNFGTFSWRIMGDWKLLDLAKQESVSGIGQGYVGWTVFGTAGLGYDPSQETLTGNVASVSTLNATVFDIGGVLDEFFWKQVALAGKLLLLGGKLDLMYHFDTNRVANDGYVQFFSYSLQNNPSIPGPLYGGFGGIARVNLPLESYVMFGAGDSSMDQPVLPWKTLSNDSWYQLLELGIALDVPALGAGNYRLTPWHNHLLGEDGFGVGLNVDQELGHKDIVAFFRFGYGDEDVTPVKLFVSGGISFERPFGRADDQVAVGVAWSDPSPGSGFRSETLLEMFYRFELMKTVSLSPDLQLVFNPADNPKTDTVVIPGVRLLMKF